MTWLYQIDKWLFLFINKSLSNPFFDWLMPYMREKLIWLPFYLFIIAFAGVNLSKRKFWLTLLGIAISAGLADTISSKMVKIYFARIRPCHAEVLEGLVNERIPCGAGYSFTSSHATNHFAVAVFLILAIGHTSRHWKPILLSWAAVIAFAQVYVGVHYPFDVLCGAGLGALIGYAVYRLTTLVRSENQY